MKTWTAKCNNGACVQVQDADTGYTMVSTTEGNDGSVTYTPGEVAKFLADVKAGTFDDLHREARERDA